SAIRDFLLKTAKFLWVMIKGADWRRGYWRWLSGTRGRIYARPIALARYSVRVFGYQIRLARTTSVTRGRALRPSGTPTCRAAGWSCTKRRDNAHKIGSPRFLRAVT